MKKLLLGIVLLAALIGVVYLKSQRAEQQRARFTEEGFEAGLAEGEEIRAQVDSLTELVNEKDSVLAESVAVREALWAGEVDSLTNQIQSREAQTVDLNDQLSSKASPSNVTAKNTPQATDEKHLEILSYYKKAVNDLPGDLSVYERRVALSEIRKETSRRFAITVSGLNSLRKDNNLDY